MKERAKIVNGNWLKFYCAGCRRCHFIQFGDQSEAGRLWKFDGNLFFPSLNPSVNFPGECRFFLIAGKMNYGVDCNHEFAGLSIDLDLIDQHEAD